MFVLLAWLLVGPIVANAADLTTEGVCAYATGRFGEAASVLRRAVGDGAANQPDFGFSDEQKGLVYLVFGHTF